jgi:murein DD-endopeptidase MepM/ murein hydrolase activator NlpD
MGRQLLPVLAIAAFLGLFGLLVALNAPGTEVASPALPVFASPTSEPNAWQVVLADGLGVQSTPLPTVALPVRGYVAPTLALLPTSGPVEAAAIANAQQGAEGIGATPTLPPPTPDPGTSESPMLSVTAQSITLEPSQWKPPALEPPISRDPLGRDHYWFLRPVDSNANNASLFYYPYGSDGSQLANPLRVHHGIDMPNPIGQPVRAAGDGVIVWSADGRQEESPIFQNSPSYGNVIVIEHDFSYRGQPLYTLYAHLSAALVRAGDRVAAGQVIGLIGNSGRVTGPHVHFEVRMGENTYSRTYNPMLWMVSYVGHGVIAGRVMDANGRLLNDHDITLRSRATGLQQDTTTSYVFQNTGFDVNADPLWRENFVIGDVPVGTYDVITNIDGQRVVQFVRVLEGTTTFVELSPVESEPAVTSEAPAGEASGGEP